MKLVVNIPDEVYKGLMERNRWFGMEVQYCGESFASYIRCGTPLPKGHGRLIDAAEVKRKMGNLDGLGMIGRCIDEFPTIIEADNTESEG